MSFIVSTTLHAGPDFRVFQTQQPAQHLIDTIAPLYGQQASMTARNNQLIVKASENILNEIALLLNDLDKPLRNLLIEVSSSFASNGNFQQDSVTGRIKVDNASIRSQSPEQNKPNVSIRYGNNGSVIKTTHTRRRNSQSKPDTYKTRTLEGQWANIEIGQKVPYYSYSTYPGLYNKNTSAYVQPWQNSVQLEDVTSGFEVYPTLNENQVTLKVRPYNRTMSRQHADQINTRSMNTVVTGKLDQWIYLGGAINQINEHNNSNFRTNKRHSDLDTSYHIKVQLID